MNTFIGTLVKPFYTFNSSPTSDFLKLNDKNLSYREVINNRITTVSHLVIVTVTAMYILTVSYLVIVTVPAMYILTVSYLVIVTVTAVYIL